MRSAAPVWHAKLSFLAYPRRRPLARIASARCSGPRNALMSAESSRLVLVVRSGGLSRIRLTRVGVPQLIRTREPLHERDGSHGGTHQILPAQRRGELFVVGEAEEVWALREIRGGHGSRFRHRIENTPPTHRCSDGWADAVRGGRPPGATRLPNEPWRARDATVHDREVPDVAGGLRMRLSSSLVSRRLVRQTWRSVARRGVRCDALMPGRRAASRRSPPRARGAGRRDRGRSALWR